MSENTKAAAQGTREAKREQERAVKHTDKIVATIKSGDDLVGKIGELLAEAKENKYHVLTGHSTWQSYVEDIIKRSEVKHLGPMLRNVVLASLIKHGVSVRAAARAAGVSPSVASAVKNGETPGENRKGGAPAGVPQTRRSPAVKLSDTVKEWTGTSEVKSTLADLKALRAQLVLALAHVDQKIAKIETAEQDKAKGEADKAERKAKNTQGTVNGTVHESDGNAEVKVSAPAAA